MRVRYLAVVVPVALLVGASPGAAQKVKPIWVAPSIGLVAGANFATFTGSDASGAKTHVGLAVGGEATINFSPTLFIQPQLLYSMKGAQQSFADTTVKVKLNYVELPLLLGLRLASVQGQVRPYLVAGPTAAYMASCRVGLSVGSLSSEAACASGSTSSFDFGVTGGAGVEVATGRVTLSLAARYFRGFSSPIKNSNIKNAGFNAAVGAVIPLGR